MPRIISGTAKLRGVPKRSSCSSYTRQLDQQETRTALRVRPALTTATLIRAPLPHGIVLAWVLVGHCASGFFAQFVSTVQIGKRESLLIGRSRHSKIMGKFFEQSKEFLVHRKISLQCSHEPLG